MLRWLVLVIVHRRRVRLLATRGCCQPNTPFTRREYRATQPKPTGPKSSCSLGGCERRRREPFAVRDSNFRQQMERSVSRFRPSNRWAVVLVIAVAAAVAARVAAPGEARPTHLARAFVCGS